MKIKLLLLMALVSCDASATVDDVKAKFKSSHIETWQKVDGIQQASNADKYRILNVKLSNSSGAVKVDFTDLERDHVTASEDYCWRLVDLTPLVMPTSWSETTPDEQELTKIYTGQLASGATKRGVIKGWSFVRGRIENTIYCSAKRESP